VMPCGYVSLTGVERTVDLESVTDVVLGYSTKRSEWTATLVFDPESKAFVELRSSPQDVRGNSSEEGGGAAEYITDTFGLTPEQISSVMKRPSEWRLIDLR